MIILLCGKAGVGKDTVGEHLIKYYHFQQDSLAAPIKKAVGIIFSIPDSVLYDRVEREKPLAEWPKWTPRSLFQFVGTEFGRNQIDKDLWVKSLFMRLRSSTDNWVITDVRFPNELDILKTRLIDVISVKIIRPGIVNALPGGIPQHESEQYELNTDYEIVNDGTLTALYTRVDSMMFTLQRIRSCESSINT